MKRSFRDAIVGFSLIGGLIIFAGSMLWLRGLRIGSRTWEIEASFKDASGLAKMSPVTYRGIFVGSVQKINFTPDSVKTKLKITHKELILAKPVIAKIVTSSVLGGDAQLSLISLGKVTSKEGLSPLSDSCYKANILCNGDSIKGEKLIGISSLTEGIEGILNQADKEDIVNKVSSSIEQFDKTQKNLDDLILLSINEINRAKPIITELREASFHLKNILSSIDDPKTLAELKDITKTTNSLTKKIDLMSNDINEIIQDKDLLNGLRNVTIGLGKFFNEIYP